jgi:hypothetical protein
MGACTAGSPHGPWRISQSPALTLAFANLTFVALGLPSLAPAEPPCTDPYARWCGRGGAVRRLPIPIRGKLPSSRTCRGICY